MVSMCLVFDVVTKQTDRETTRRTDRQADRVTEVRVAIERDRQNRARQTKHIQLYTLLGVLYPKKRYCHFSTLAQRLPFPPSSCPSLKKQHQQSTNSNKRIHILIHIYMGQCPSTATLTLLPSHRKNVITLPHREEEGAVCSSFFSLLFFSLCHRQQLLSCR